MIKGSLTLSLLTIEKADFLLLLLLFVLSLPFDSKLTGFDQHITEVGTFNWVFIGGKIRILAANITTIEKSSDILSNVTFYKNNHFKQEQR